MDSAVIISSVSKAVKNWKLKDRIRIQIAFLYYQKLHVVPDLG